MPVTGELFFGLGRPNPGRPATFDDVTIQFINETDRFGIAPNVVGVTRPDLVTLINTDTGVRAVVRGAFPAPIPVLDAINPSSGAYQAWINAALPVRILDMRVETNDFILTVDFDGAGPTVDDFYHRWTPADLFALSPTINDVAYGPDGEPLPVPVDPVELTGTPGPDALTGDAGNDRLLGEAGDDTLDGGLGSDTLNGGDGDDIIIGGPGEGDLRDVIFGGEGNDSIDAGAGNDQIFGQGGNDTIAGGAGVDEIQGQDGDDVITGSSFSDLVFGGAGDDFVNGGFGHDRINGGLGADKFFHVGVEGHGSDWVQDYSSAEGDVLLFGNASATRSQFQVNFAHTENAEGERAGDDAVQEAFVIYRPTGQIMWALVDGAGQESINLQIGGDMFDLLA